MLVLDIYPMFNREARDDGGVDMGDLAEQIAIQDYRVDPEQVATEILRKLRLIKTARHELAIGPGRTPGPPVRDP